MHAGGIVWYIASVDTEDSTRFTQIHDDAIAAFDYLDPRLDDDPFWYEDGLDGHLGDVSTARSGD